MSSDINDHGIAPDPLSSAKAKLGWATDHLKRLSAEIESTLSADENVFVAEREGEARYILSIRMVPIPMYRWGLTLGDAIQGLRGALDHAAWQLVLRDNDGPPKSKRDQNRIQFPIYEREDRFRKATILGYVSDHSRTILDDAQPYKRGKYHPLANIAALSNDDKHRVLIPAFLDLAEGSFHLGIAHNQDISAVGRPNLTIQAGDSLKDGAILGHVDVVVCGPNPDMDVQGEFPGLVGFKARGGLVIGLATLGKLAIYTQGILKRIQLLFDGHIPRP